MLANLAETFFTRYFYKSDRQLKLSQVAQREQKTFISSSQVINDHEGLDGNKDLNCYL